MCIEADASLGGETTQGSHKMRVLQQLMFNHQHFGGLNILKYRQSYQGTVFVGDPAKGQRLRLFLHWNQSGDAFFCRSRVHQFCF